MGVYFSSYQSGVNVFCDVSQNCELTDSLSRIACQEIHMVECGDGPCDKAVINNGLLLCDCEDSVNCNPCTNDRAFWNVINPTDVLTFQFQQIDTVNGQNPLGPFGNWGGGQFINGYIRDCCTGEYLGGETPSTILFYAGSAGVGVFPVRDYKGNITWNNIQQIQVFPEYFIPEMAAQFPGWDGCFVFEWVFNEGTANEYKLCSEPYKVNPCPEKGDTVLLEGVFPDRDCFGYYYGTEAVGNSLNNFPFVNQYRVHGSNEQTSFLIEKQFVGTRLKSTSSDVTENWLFRTKGVPGKIAKLITNILAARNVYLDGVEFVADGEVPKNNETGSQWFIDANLKRVDCSKTYSCN